mgnify:CR=1 FL=1
MTTKVVYLDNAATSWPKPPQVMAAMQHYLGEVGANPGRSGHRLSIEAARVVYRTREAVAGLLGVSDPLRVVFSANGTHALNLALFGLLDAYPLTTFSSLLAIVVIVIFFVTSIDSAALVNDMFATGEEDTSPTSYRIGWALAIGAVAGALLLISPATGIATLQEVVIIVAFPFFLMQFIMMYSLVKGMSDDVAAQRQLRTRQWEKTDTAEKLEAYESRPAPGYDAEGNPLPVPVLEHDDDGNIVIPGNVVIGGDLGVVGDLTDDPDEAAEMESRFRIVEQSRPRTQDNW